MNTRILKILISSGLILVFTAFNAGIPIALSICPMMNDGADNCEMMPPETHSALSFTSEIPDCCSTHIIAERNTTPYLPVDQFKVSHLLPLGQIAITADDTYLMYGRFSLTEVQCVSPSPPFSETVSLSILNSTLLI
jgi:hypothetical protein